MNNEQGKRVVVKRRQQRKKGAEQQRWSKMEKAKITGGG